MQTGDAFAALLSGIIIDDKLIPVVTVVLYFGKISWNGAVRLSDMLRVAPCQSIRELIHDTVMHLIDPHSLSDQEREELLKLLPSS